MEASHFVLAYYLGLVVFVGNFIVVWRNIKTKEEIKVIENRIVDILRARKRRR